MDKNICEEIRLIDNILQAEFHSYSIVYIFIHFLFYWQGGVMLVF